MTPRSEKALSQSLLSDLGRKLKSAGEPEWLERSLAADIIFDSEDGAGATTTTAELEHCLSDLPVDIVVQPAANRKKKLLIADMDSTMIGQECIDELAGEVGVKDRVSAITERAMRGEIEFEPALRERVALLAGLPESIVSRVIDSHITVTPGAGVLISTMRQNGAYCALVSGGFTAFTEIIASQIGFDENSANRLIARGGYFTGQVEEPILGRDAKRARLIALCTQRGIGLDEAIAVGDGANDLEMVDAAGLGIAFHAKPALADKADAAIRHCDLTALLYAQGYKSEEFVGGE